MGRDRRPPLWRGARGLVVAATAALCMALSCAYYNIFWMAEQEYDKAIASTALADFWDPYDQPKPSGEALKSIDSCAKRCGKILLLYPKSKWVDDALIMMGNCFLLKGEYANAMRKYDEVITIYATSEFAEEARYMKAYTHVLEGDSEQALILLESRGGDERRSRWQERAIFLQARIYEKRGDCGNAVPPLEAYLERYPEGQKATEATLLVGECLIRLGRQNEALSILAPLAGRQDLSGTIASLRLGRAYRELGNAEKSLEVFGRLSEGTVADSLRARALLETGITLDKEARYEEAVGALTLADSLGKNTLLGEAQYRLGLVSEKGLSDLDKAAAAYQEASKVQSPFGKLAAKRAAALKAMAKYEAALTDTTVKTVEAQAMNRFVLAETYLHDLGLTAKALEQYTILSDSMAVNPLTARAMLAVGSLLAAGGDTLAHRYYRALIDSFPTTVFANVARSELGLPLVDIISAVPDSAEAAGSDSAAAVPASPEGSTAEAPGGPGSEEAPGSEEVPGSGEPDTTAWHEAPRSAAPGESLGVDQRTWPRGDGGPPWPPRPWERDSTDTARSPSDTSGALQDTTGLPLTDWGEQ